LSICQPSSVNNFDPISGPWELTRHRGRQINANSLDKHREHSSQRGKFKLILNVKPKSQPWSQLIAKKAKAAGDWPELWARTASCQSSARFGSVYSFRPYSLSQAHCQRHLALR